MTDRGAAIAGVYTTVQGEHRGRRHHHLLREAILGALADAGLGVDDLDGLANIRSENKSAAVAAPGLWADLLGRTIVYHDMSDVAGASHTAAVAHAAAHVSAGFCDTVVVVSGWMRGTRREIIEEMAYMHGEFDASWGSLAASWFAMVCRELERTRKITAEQRAHIAVAARAWASRHDQALRQDPLTVEDVLRSTPIAEPLRMLDCGQTNNGSGAVVVTTLDRARATGRPLVGVLGAGEAYTGRGYTDVSTALEAGGGTISARRALTRAGLTTDGIDLFGLYDPFSFAPLYLLEEVGYCTSAEAGELAESGAFLPGGSLAVNTHGGAMSWGNSLNILAHLIEAVRQLQGRADERQLRSPRTALLHGFGGTLNLNSTVVLGAV